MTFAYRRNPSEIAARARRNNHRAVVGLASCIAGLIGFGVAATQEAQERISTAQEIVTDHLQPPSVHRGAKQTAQPPHVLTAQTSELVPANELPLKALGATAIAVYTGLAGLGFANRRSRECDVNGHDVATEDTYHLYTFEQPAAPVSYDTGYADQLDQRIANADHKASETLIRARLGSDLTLKHLTILREMDRNPLEALTYHA